MPSQELAEPSINPASELLMYASPLAGMSAIGLGLASLFGKGPSILRDRPLVSVALVCGGSVLLAKSQFDRFLLEEPDYKVEREVNGLEIRTYAPRLVAETTVDAPNFDEARKLGFQRLAGYLFGDNAPEERLSMTTPVTLAETSGRYVMRFQMPKHERHASLPRPNDPRVVLRRLPRDRVAVLRFSGTYAATKIEAKQRELLERVEAAGFQAAGQPSFAGYDSPAALPPLRRVEVWVSIS
jgi:hypothetical protein